MDLKEWALTFTKHKDLAFRRIESIEEKGKDFFVKQKDKKVIANHVAEKLTSQIIDAVKKSEHNNVFCLNEEENLEFLTKEWDRFKTMDNLTFIFANIKNNDKWIINPKLHSMIADPASIKLGLRAMFDTANGKVDSGPSKRKPKIFDDDVADEDDSEE